MPDLIVIVGPPASGKTTVGHALAALAGFRLFHNHLTADAAAALFGWGTPLYLESTAEMRLSLLRRAVGETGSPSIVFTFVWAFGLPDDHRFMAELAELFESRGQRVFYVELAASLEARLAREGTPFRVATKPVKRDVEAARRLLHEFDAKFEMNSRGRFPHPDRHLLIDTERHAPEAAARLVCERFGFPMRGDATP